MKPCWILSCRRSGSTYLCGLLNSTAIFPQRWKEYYCDPLDKKNLEELPVVNKILYDQYYRIKNRIKIEEELPNIKYVFLRRKDLHAVTVSKFLISKTLGMGKDGYDYIWNVFDKKSLEEFQKIEVDYDLGSLKKMHKKTVIDYNSWNRFLRNENFIEFDYQDIIDSPIECVYKILEFMECEKVNPKLDWPYLSMKMEHPKKKEFTERFRKEMHISIPLMFNFRK